MQSLKCLGQGRLKEDKRKSCRRDHGLVSETEGLHRTQAMKATGFVEVLSTDHTTLDVITMLTKKMHQIPKV